MQRAGRAPADGRRVARSLHARARRACSCSRPADCSARGPTRRATVMTITLGGGAPGPQNGGMTTIGGRAGAGGRRRPRRPSAKRVRPPAAKAPEMTVPEPSAKPAKAGAAPAVKQAPDEARGRTPTQRRRDAARAARSPKPARAARASACRRAAAPGSGSTLDVADFCCPDYLDADGRAASARTGMRSAERAGEVMVKFTIQRDGTHRRTSSSSSRAATPRSTSDAQRALVVHAAAAAAAGAVPEPDADRSPQFPVPHDEPTLFTADPSPPSLAVVAARRRRRRAAAAGSRRRRRRSSRARSARRSQRRRRRAAALRRARLHRAVERRRDRRRRQDDRAGAVGRPELRARVRPDPARHRTRRFPPATSIADVPFDRWRELSADGVVVGTVQKTGAGVRVEVRLFNVRTRQSAFAQGVQRLGRQPAALRAHDRRRDPPAAARAARRRADEADVHLGSRRRADGRHGREPRRQGDLHLRLRRREPAPRHDQPLAEHQRRPGRPTAARSRTRRTAAACRTSSSRTSTRARSRS